MAAISLVGSMLTQLARYELGVHGESETGPVEPRRAHDRSG